MAYTCILSYIISYNLEYICNLGERINVMNILENYACCHWNCEQRTRIVNISVPNNEANHMPLCATVNSLVQDGL